MSGIGTVKHIDRNGNEVNNGGGIVKKASAEDSKKASANENKPLFTSHSKSNETNEFGDPVTIIPDPKAAQYTSAQTRELLATANSDPAHRDELMKGLMVEAGNDMSFDEINNDLKRKIDSYKPDPSKSDSQATDTSAAAAQTITPHVTDTTTPVAQTTAPQITATCNNSTCKGLFKLLGLSFLQGLAGKGSPDILPVAKASENSSVQNVPTSNSSTNTDNSTSSIWDFLSNLFTSSSRNNISNNNTKINTNITEATFFPKLGNNSFIIPKPKEENFSINQAQILQANL